MNRTNCIDVWIATRVGRGCKGYVLQRFDPYFKNVGENELVILGSDLNVYVGKDANDYDGFGYGGRNIDAKRTLEMGSALDIIISNRFLQKQDIRLIINSSGPS